MYISHLFRTVCYSAVVCAGALALPAIASAQSVASQGEQGINCYLPPLRLSAIDINAFLGGVESDLARFQYGGQPLSNRIRMLAASDVRTLGPIVQHVQFISSIGGADTPAVTVPSDPATDPATDATTDATTPAIPATPVATLKRQQMTAIAQGLAAATVACSRGGNELGTKIQEKVAETNVQPFVTAYLDALKMLSEEQVETASIGDTGFGPIGGNIGSAGEGGSGSGQSSGDSSITTPSGDFRVARGSRYFSSDGGGGSNSQDISATRP
jgi:hypothetical protein